MATLKPTVKSKLKTGMYIVYIRVVEKSLAFAPEGGVALPSGANASDFSRL